MLSNETERHQVYNHFNIFLLNVQYSQKYKLIKPIYVFMYLFHYNFVMKPKHFYQFYIIHFIFPDYEFIIHYFFNSNFFSITQGTNVVTDETSSCIVVLDKCTLYIYKYLREVSNSCGKKMKIQIC